MRVLGWKSASCMRLANMTNVLDLQGCLDYYLDAQRQNADRLAGEMGLLGSDGKSASCVGLTGCLDYSDSKEPNLTNLFAGFLRLYCMVTWTTCWAEVSEGGDADRPQWGCLDPMAAALCGLLRLHKSDNCGLLGLRKSDKLLD
jgi:hypothetical protein